ncbi:MAG: tetratricopeptide repeat protein [Thermodesulfobacteriota bacterium]|nr:tetratricopeptide repeat protein [Thermodesulfobacteriota bacterium]
MIFRIWSILKLLYLYLAYFAVGLDEEFYYISKGNHLLDGGFFSAAAKAYKRVLKETQSPYVYSSLGYCYLNVGLYDKAIENLEIAYSKKSTPEFAVGLIRAKYENGDYEESKKLFQSIKKVDVPNTLPGLEEEIESLKELLEKNPNQAR